MWKITLVIGFIIAIGVTGKEYPIPQFGSLWYLTCGSAFTLFSGIMTIITEWYRIVRKNYFNHKEEEKIITQQIESH